MIIHLLTGQLFRIVQAPDSDDEPTPENSPASHSVNLSVPTKLNGTSSTKLAPAYSSVDDDQPNEVRHSRRKRNHSLTNNYHFTIYSSHSSSRHSNSSSSDDTSSNDSRRKISR